MSTPDRLTDEEREARRKRIDTFVEEWTFREATDDTLAGWGVHMGQMLYRLPRDSQTDDMRESVLAMARDAADLRKIAGLAGAGTSRATRRGDDDERTRWIEVARTVAAALSARPAPDTLADRVQAQADAVRQSLAGIGHLKTAQRALIDLGVAWDDAGRVLSAVQHAYVASVNAALLAGRSDASPEGGEHQAPAAQAAADERARIVWWLRASASGPAGVNHSEDYVRAVYEMAAAIEQHPERFADAPTKDTTP